MALVCRLALAQGGDWVAHSVQLLEEGSAPNVIRPSDYNKGVTGRQELPAVWPLVNGLALLFALPIPP